MDMCEHGFYLDEKTRCKKQTSFVLSKVEYGCNDVEVRYLCKDHKIQFENDDPYGDYNFTIRELPKNKS